MNKIRNTLPPFVRQEALHSTGERSGWIREPTDEPAAAGKHLCLAAKQLAKAGALSPVDLLMVGLLALDLQFWRMQAHLNRQQLKI